MSHNDIYDAAETHPRYVHLAPVFRYDVTSQLLRNMKIEILMRKLGVGETPFTSYSIT